MYDLGPDGIHGTGDDIGETRITDDSEVQNNPKIYGDKIVWQDDRNDKWDIYMYNLSSGLEVQITNNIKNQTDPDIYENKIVWQDDRNDKWDIYMYDLGSDGEFGTEDDGGEVRVTSNPANQNNPAIYGNKIVWTDYRKGNADIYMSQIKNEPPAFEIDEDSKILKAVPEQEFSKNIKDISSYSDPEDDEPKYSDDTDLFDIDSDTGQIDFTPKKEDHGYHKVNIKVMDGWDREAEDAISIIIKIGELTKMLDDVKYLLK